MMVQERDQNGNVIYYRGLVKHRVNVQFVGNNNTLLIHNEAKELSGVSSFMVTSDISLLGQCPLFGDR